MTEQRELLELAAKAAGIHFWEMGGTLFAAHGKSWNPATDDGDGARLEEVLGIDVEWQRIGVIATHRSKDGSDVVAREPYADHGGDKQAARRMASLKVAAAIGRVAP